MKLKGMTLKVLDEIKKDPRVSFRELAQRCRLSSPSVVYYHITKLEAAGEITRKPGARGIYIERQRAPRNVDATKGVATRKANAKKRGTSVLPKMSRSELEKRIDMVVAKAKASEEPQLESRDVVRELPGKMLKSVKCHRIG